VTFTVGHKKVGGKRKGSRNKATLEQAKAIAESGLTPLDYLLSVYRDKSKPDNERLDAAKGAAPYVHRKQPTAIEQTNMDTYQDLSEDELLQRLKDLEK